MPPQVPQARPVPQPPQVPRAAPNARTAYVDPSQPLAAPTYAFADPAPVAGPNARTYVDPSQPPGPSARSPFVDPSQPLPGPFTAVPVPAPPARPPVVLEVTPRGLGIGTVAGYCEELIRRNSRLPAEMKKLFTTSRDSQDVVRIVVCQGESRRLDSNVVIGDLVLQNLPRRPRGETSIEVTFSVDASGILQVRARDSQTGTEQSARLDLVGSMPDVASSRDRIQQLRR